MVIESYTNIILEHCRCSRPPSGGLDAELMLLVVSVVLSWLGPHGNNRGRGGGG